MNDYPHYIHRSHGSNGVLDPMTASQNNGEERVREEFFSFFS